MIRLLRWLLGYVEFCFSDGFTAHFLSACHQKEYNISRVKIKGEKLYASCPPGLLEAIVKTAGEHGGSITVIKKRGLYFQLIKLKNRWGMFAGLVAGLLLISVITGFIWNIDIVGNEKLSEEELRSFLAQNGFYEGVWAKSADVDTVENLLLASFDEIAWAHINRSGTSARVEIGEGVAAPKTVKRKKICNLKAKKDGVIVKAVVYDGWQRVKEGEAVTKGDLLISGVYQSENNRNLYTHARGEYIARVKEPFTLTVSRQQQYQNVIGEREYRYCYLFGLKIPLFFGSSEVKNSQTQEKTQYLRVNKKQLPLGIVTKTVREYTVETRELTDSELTALTEQETEKKIAEEFGKYEIIKRKLSTSLHADSAEVRGYLLCHENIGKEVRLKKKRN